MKSLTIGTAALAIVAAGPVFAADVPVATPVSAPAYVAAPSYNWTGFYFGGNGGYGWVSAPADASVTGGVLNGLAATGGTNPRGPIAGGQVGFNWQTGNLVFGVEGDFQWSNQRQAQISSCGAACTITETATIDYFGTARVRVGAAFDRILLYATGGAAWTHATDTVNVNVVGVNVNLFNLSDSKLGWTAGGGIEMAVWDSWTAKLEYLYIDTSGITGSSTIPILGGTISETARLKDSIVRVGLNYRFPVPGAPVSARY